MADESSTNLQASDRSLDSETRTSRQPRYVVVARRYRPKSFGELVGQAQVTQAISNAIKTDRVGHAYLFTGARGVGKTSTARIFGKALNCVDGPTPTPCNQCDICQSISSGEDVDVLEIDGASNRGIDEIRQLRSNVGVRPSRSRYKIYIIDEVHMLTNQAFNALLKTLEEPPEHVKFIFCTTDPEKIPITVLSRCQRFDFAPVETGSIEQRLQEIVQLEQGTIDQDALHVIARRAAGSMRDSQSLLEQLLSYCGKQITVDDVHAMLGTAQSGRIESIVAHLCQDEPASALNEVDNAIREGVDAGQLAEQLIGYFRDMMVATLDCNSELILHAQPQQFAQLKEDGKRFGVQRVLAIQQILDQAITRMRQSGHARTLLEVAIVRICLLGDLESLSSLVQHIKSGQPLAMGAAPAARPAADSSRTVAPPVSGGLVADATVQPTLKKNEKVAEKSVTVQSPVEKNVDFSSDQIVNIWSQAVDDIGDMTADLLRSYDSLAIRAPNQLVVKLKSAYNKELCERADRKKRIEDTLSRITGKSIRVDFEASATRSEAPKPQQTTVSKRQLMRDLEKHSMVAEAIEVFEAEVVDVDPPRKPR